jgi:hypothetical protein
MTDTDTFYVVLIVILAMVVTPIGTLFGVRLGVRIGRDRERLEIARAAASVQAVPTTFRDDHAEDMKDPEYARAHAEEEAEPKQIIADPEEAPEAPSEPLVVKTVWTEYPNHPWHGMPGFGAPVLTRYFEASYVAPMECAGDGLGSPATGHQLLEGQQVYLIPLTRTGSDDDVLLVCYDHGRPDAEW